MRQSPRVDHDSLETGRGFLQAADEVPFAVELFALDLYPEFLRPRLEPAMNVFK